MKFSTLVYGMKMFIFIRCSDCFSKNDFGLCVRSAIKIFFMCTALYSI